METITLIRGDDKDNDWRRSIAVDMKHVLEKVPTLVNAIRKK